MHVSSSGIAITCRITRSHQPYSSKPYILLWPFYFQYVSCMDWGFFFSLFMFYWSEKHWHFKLGLAGLRATVFFTFACPGQLEMLIVLVFYPPSLLPTLLPLPPSSLPKPPLPCPSPFHNILIHPPLPFQLCKFLHVSCFLYFPFNVIVLVLLVGRINKKKRHSSISK